MKKKIISIFIIILLTTGCTTIESNSYDEILTNTTNTLVNTTNINRVGYKYYLPKGMRLLSYEGSNEIISHGENIYYLYVDYVSYYNKIPSSYTESKTAVYSKNILKDKYKVSGLCCIDVYANEYFGIIIEVNNIYKYDDEIDIKVSFHIDSFFLVEINFDIDDMDNYDEIYYYNGKYYANYKNICDSNIIYDGSLEIVNKGIRIK